MNVYKVYYDEKDGFLDYDDVYERFGDVVEENKQLRKQLEKVSQIVR